MAVYLISAVDNDEHKGVVVIKANHLKVAAEAAYAYRETFFGVEPSVRPSGADAEVTGEKGVFVIGVDYVDQYGQPWRHTRKVRVKRTTLAKALGPKLEGTRVYR